MKCNYHLFRRLSVYLLIFFVWFGTEAFAQGSVDEYVQRMEQERTDNEAIEQKIDELIQEMTLEEKVGQMTQVNETFFGSDGNTGGATGGQANVLDEEKLRTTLQKYHIGSFLTGGIRPAEEWYRLVDKLQHINMEESRLDIPVIFGIDHVHGTNYIKEGTIFPQQINVAATFDTTFAYQTGVVTAREAAPLGHHWNFAPILDVGREARWPRLYETYGEDPIVSAKMGAAYVNGIQSVEMGPHKMAATAKHYLGYSIPESGWDRTPVEISFPTFQERIVPPFDLAIDEGIKTVMLNSGEINGTPVHASYRIITTMLRDQLGFEGVALTDWMDIIKLHSEHYVTENEKESTYKAIMAGVDMSMTPTTIDFCGHLVELVEEGRIPMERINLSVRRILRLKLQLGLFEHPYPTDEYLDVVGSEEHHTQSKQAAEESIVLLKNKNDILPLDDAKNVLVVGPNADSRNVLAGGWTYTWQGDDESTYPRQMKTLRQAMKAEFGDAEISTAKAGNLEKAARETDAIVVAAGEKPYAEGWGNLNDFDLPDEQLALIEEAAATGKPVILVLIEGRPRTFGTLIDKVDGIVFAGLPGYYGGEAISRVLSGRVNPSGKMSVTYPFRQAHMITYDYKPMQYSYLNVTDSLAMRYTIGKYGNRIGEFGTGLSYSDFEYGQIDLSDTLITGNETLKATVTVTNTSDRAGKEAVIWFVQDEVAERTRPVKEMQHFEKQLIEAGQSKTYTFTIEPQKHLGYPDANGNIILEDGYFTIMTGNSSERFYYETE